MLYFFELCKNVLLVLSDFKDLWQQKCWIKLTVLTRRQGGKNDNDDNCSWGGYTCQSVI